MANPSPAQRAAAQQIEAEVRDTLERSLRPQSDADVDRTVAEHLRHLGLPVIQATHRTVGHEMNFDLKLAVPRGEG